MKESQNSDLPYCNRKIPCKENNDRLGMGSVLQWSLALTNPYVTNDFLYPNIIVSSSIKKPEDSGYEIAVYLEMTSGFFWVVDTLALPLTFADSQRQQRHLVIAPRSKL